jgi:spore germination protein YaaH
MKRVLWVIALITVMPFIMRASHDSPLQSAATPEATAEDVATWCVSVWYPSSDVPGGLDSIENNSDLIHVINAFWYVPLPDGTLQKTNAAAEDADQLAQWRADDMTIIATIYGNTWQMLTDPMVRASHIDQIVALAERMSYDGIDIDYESFPVATRDAFSDFIEALSAKLHAHGKLLTVAVHPKTDDAGSWYGAAAQDWKRLAPAVDVFTIMTYDYTDRNQPPGPISPPNWVHDVLTYAATITNLQKVRMGLAFYGYSWLRDNPPATTTTWDSAQRLINSFRPEIQRDPADMEAHIEVKARGLPRQTIYFADSVGIEYKLDQIMTDFPQLGGVAIWGIGGEDPADWNVLRERAAQQPNCNLKR